MSDLSRYIEPLAETFSAWAPSDINPSLVLVVTRQDARALLAPGGIIDRIVTEENQRLRATVARVEAIAARWEQRAELHGRGHSMLATFYDDHAAELGAALDGATGSES